MDKTSIIAVVAAAIIMIIAFGAGRFKLRPRTLNKASFQSSWSDIQKLCGNKDTWPLAVINADKLLDDALKKLRFRGKTMGERMVAAHKSFTDSDGAWYGHKLRNKLVHEHNIQLKERDIKDALVGIRQALKDLGALK
jgi:hypothetical protein